MGDQAKQTSADAEFVYETNSTVEEIACVLQDAKDVLILTHSKPDGDALGTSLGLHRGLRQLGVPSMVLLAGPIDQNLLTLVKPDDSVHRLEEHGLPDESRPWWRSLIPARGTRLNRSPNG